jgi:maltooligosyltrehalose synthase
VLLKITSPGIPDFFQGNELWDFSLVDPDNRRPVDFKLRQKFLKELKTLEAKEEKSLPSQLLSTWKDGRIKLFITYKALQTQKPTDLFCQENICLSNISPEKETGSLPAVWRSRVLTGPPFFSQLTELEEHL